MKNLDGEMVFLQLRELQVLLQGLPSKQGRQELVDWKRKVAFRALPSLCKHIIKNKQAGRSFYFCKSPLKQGHVSAFPASLHDCIVKLCLNS